MVSAEFESCGLEILHRSLLLSSRSAKSTGSTGRGCGGGDCVLPPGSVAALQGLFIKTAAEALAGLSKPAGAGAHLAATGAPAFALPVGVSAPARSAVVCYILMRAFHNLTASTVWPTRGA
jgi:hypothetical protein